MKTDVSILGSDRGEGGAHVRRHLDRFGLAGVSDPAASRVLYLGDAAALATDVRELCRVDPDALIIEITGTPRDLAQPHLSFGARDGDPSDERITLDEWLDAGVSPLELAFRRWPLPRPRRAILAVDLDAFNLPGVAAPAALGLTANDFWPLYRAWLTRLEVTRLGLYGVVPAHDVGGVTADFAARLGRAFLAR